MHSDENVTEAFFEAIQKDDAAAVLELIADTEARNDLGLTPYDLSKKDSRKFLKKAAAAKSKKAG